MEKYKIFHIFENTKLNRKNVRLCRTYKTMEDAQAYLDELFEDLKVSNSFDTIRCDISVKTYSVEFDATNEWRIYAGQID